MIVSMEPLSVINHQAGGLLDAEQMITWQRFFDFDVLAVDNAETRMKNYFMATIRYTTEGNLNYELMLFYLRGTKFDRLGMLLDVFMNLIYLTFDSPSYP